MNDPNAEFNAIKTTVIGGLKSALTLAGASGAPLIAPLFAAEAIFRIVQFGRDVKRAQEQIVSGLDRKIRDRDIFREPIYEGMDESAALDFFRPGGLADQNQPSLFSQLQPEVQEIQNFPLSAEAESRRTLMFAHRFLRPIFGTTTFDDPKLDEKYGAWLDPKDPQYGRIARDAARLFIGNEYTRQDLIDRSKKYFLQKLKSEIELEHQAIVNAQQEMAEIFGRLVRGALFGDGQMIDRTLDFAKDLRLVSLDQEIAKFQAEKDNANTSSARKAELTIIISDLIKLKTRISAL